MHTSMLKARSQVIRSQPGASSKLTSCVSTLPFKAARLGGNSRPTPVTANVATFPDVATDRFARNAVRIFNSHLKLMR